MSDDQVMAEVMEAQQRRRAERREFLRYAGGISVAAGAAAIVGACDNNDSGTSTPTPSPTASGSPTPTPTATGTTGVSDVDIFNFALNLEYLEAQFYAFAASGSGLASTLLTGTGTQGAVTGGRQVSFSDPVIAQFAREIAADEAAHVEFLRSALGSSAIAQPAIDIGATATSAFSNAARAAGLIGAGQAFDPYASDENFLLGAFLFEDVGVTAYKGAAQLITSPVFLQAAAGILATEAYHAAMVRTQLYTKGIQTPSLIDSTEAISNARDGLDGSGDIDQGVRPIANQSNIAPLDGDGLAYGRTTGQVLNVVYLNAGAATGGGFFPAGVNGNIKTSTAN